MKDINFKAFDEIEIEQFVIFHNKIQSNIVFVLPHSFLFADLLDLSFIDPKKKKNQTNRILNKNYFYHETSINFSVISISRYECLQIVQIIFFIFYY